MQQTIDSFFKFNEGTVVRQVANSTGHLAAQWVLLKHIVPWVGQSLFHAQRNFLLVLVDSENHHFNFVANGNKFAWMINSASPGHFADVNQTFDTIFQFDERTVGQHVDNFPGDASIDRVLLGDVFPRALGLLLESQSNLFFFVIDIQNHHFDLLIDLNHLSRMVDSSPAHVCDVQQTVDAAEVNKRTEIGDVLDGTQAGIADGEVFEKLFLFFLASFFDQAATRHNDVLASFVDLQNHTFDVFADVIRDVGWTAHVHLTCWQKHVDTVLDDRFAVDFAADLNQ